MRVGYNKIQKPIIVIVAVCATAMLIAGCENNSSSTPVAISPASVILEAAKTNVVEFVASGGGSNYVWSLEDTTLGTIVYTVSNTVFYQNTTNIGTNYLTVTAMDSGGNFAIATITQN